ncbi:choice-of-anchor E domain-containing protein [Duganella aceris]|jgi:hypothetical protein|uniref:choice-of-anchor E domain-containing protein n=1 Tax=Duganella aceris TaxID=2703883 RepID=UPI001E6558D8|nr:choice-of-anchor E domain-containing protein [Duganella aceris]
MKKALTLLAAGAVLTVAASAQAAPAPAPLVLNTNVISNIKKSTGVLDFTQFNATNGTLLSVQIELFSDLDSKFSVENKGKSATTFTLDSASSVSLSSSVFSLATLVNNYHSTVSKGAFDLTDDYAGTSGTVVTLAPQHQSVSAVFTDAATLAAFTGTGSVAATVTGLGTTKITASGNVHTAATSAYSAYGTVTYTFAAPVPEPETYAMLLAGLGLVGFAARRRKSA